MKKIGFLSFFLTFTLCLSAKTITISNISNVRAEVQEQQIAVHYVLDSKQAVDVKLQYSIDYGRTWFDCKSITGDLQAQTSGRKTILWDCRKDGFEKGSLMFQVILTPKSILRATYKKKTFGLALGIGSQWITELGKNTYGSLNLGWTINFSRYIGWDIFTVNIIVPYDYGLCAMTGLRFYAPNLIKNKKGYAAIKAGYCYGHYSFEDHQVGGYGLAYELETGLQLSKRLFIGLTYSAQKSYEPIAPNVSFIHFAGLRMGWNF